MSLSLHGKRRLTRLLLLFVVSLSLAYCSEDAYFDPIMFLPDGDVVLSQKDPDPNLHFFVLSDWGFNGSDDQVKVASEMDHFSQLVGIKFILTCGDNFQNALIKSDSDLLWKTNYEDVYDDSSLMVPWYPALGNHDYNGDPQAEVDYSSINPDWDMPSRYYTFVQAVDSNTSVRFIVLDTPALIDEIDQLTNANYSSIAQYSWLKKTLSEAKEKWIIVTGHHPVFSAGSYHGDTKEMIDVVKPLLNEYKVDFYICGHDHDFEHAREKGYSTDYIVTGTGGSLRPAGSNSHTVFSFSRFGFTYVSLSQNIARLYFITSDGEIGYNYQKLK
jgi:tartrate-resistant acid phosphatase type 5